MAEELYFFKFDSEIAREKLLPLIDKEEEFSFTQHFYSKYAGIGVENDLILENIRKKITENIELLSEDELWCFYDWFGDKNYNNNEHLSYNDNEKRLYEEMSSYGLGLFFEIPSKAPVRKFHSLMGDYEYLALADENIEKTCDAEQLVAFLDYGACFVAELRFVINKYYYKENDDCEDNLEVKRIIDEMNLDSNSFCYKLALSEMETRRTSDIAIIESLSEMIKFRQTMKNESSYSYPIEFREALDNESDFLNSYYMLEVFSEIKKKIGNYKGKIAMLHSC